MFNLFINIKVLFKRIARLWYCLPSGAAKLHCMYVSNTSTPPLCLQNPDGKAWLSCKIETQPSNMCSNASKYNNVASSKGSEISRTQIV